MIKNHTIIASGSSWIESGAIDQIEALKRLDGVTGVVGLPDLHPGRGVPLGCVTITKGVVYPHIIGNDIGCGMSLFRTSFTREKCSQSALVKRLQKYQKQNNGLIGGGNHFAEFQTMEHLLAEEGPFDKRGVYLLVHSGSRDLGHSVYNHYIRDHNGQHGFAEGTELFDRYMDDHGRACLYAKENRRTIAREIARVCKCTVDEEPIVESEHNYVEKISVDTDEYFLHRKGAASAQSSFAVIPGSRGALTYVVRPKNSSLESGFSLPHGAGRKWNRKECKGRLDRKYTKASLTRTALNSVVVTSSKDILFQEAPEAYKNIETVLSDLETFGLVDRAASLKPLVTYKD